MDFKWRLEKGNSDHFPCSVKQPTTLFGRGQQYLTFCPIALTFSRWMWSLCSPLLNGFPTKTRASQDPLPVSSFHVGSTSQPASSIRRCNSAKGPSASNSSWVTWGDVARFFSRNLGDNPMNIGNFLGTHRLKGNQNFPT